MHIHIHMLVISLIEFFTENDYVHALFSMFTYSFFNPFSFKKTGWTRQPNHAHIFSTKQCSQSNL